MVILLAQGEDPIPLVNYSARPPAGGISRNRARLSLITDLCTTCTHTVLYTFYQIFVTIE
jgi:hypothetical protein